MLVRKGILCFIVDEEGKQTNESVNMDIDRELEVDNIFNWKPSKWDGVKFKVIGFMDFFPLIAEVE